MPAIDAARSRSAAVRHTIGGCRQLHGAWTIAFSIVVCVLVMLASAVSSPRALADTLAQREACTPDVFRLCSDYIPDRGSIVERLTRNNSRLSLACRAVFAGKLR